MDKKEAAAIVGSFKKAIRETVVVKKGQRQSTDGEYVEAGETRLSLVKYIKGTQWGDWSNAEAEEKVAKALSTAAGSQGGTLLPASLAGPIIDKLRETAVIRSIDGVSVEPMSVGKLDMGRIDEGPTVSWGAEGGTMTEDTTLKTGKTVLELDKATCLIKASNELLRDGGGVAENIVRSALGKAMAVEEDRVILRGTGGTQPLGIYFNPRIHTTDLSAHASFDNFLDAMEQIRLANGRANAMVADPRLVFDLRKLKDGEGRYVWHDPTGSQGDKGIGVVQTGRMWDLRVYDTTAIGEGSYPDADETFAVVGDFRELLIGESRDGMMIESSPHVYFASDETAIRLIFRVGYILKQAAAFALVRGIIH